MKVIRKEEAEASNRRDEDRAYYSFDDAELIVIEYGDVTLDEEFHSHDFPEIVLCLDGHVTAEIQGQPGTTLDPGDLIRFDPGEQRRLVRNSGGERFLVVKLPSLAWKERVKLGYVRE